MPTAERHRPLAVALAVTVGVAGLGLASVAYGSLIERRSFRLRRVEAPVLPAGAPSIRVLHLSDLHLTPRQRSKEEWLSRLAGLEPDLVIDTGDNIADAEAGPFVTRSLGRLLDRPGVFVWGSNDYYGPKYKNPARYLSRKEHRPNPDPQQLPWRELGAVFTAAGWHELTEQRVSLDIKGLRVELRGTDDAHLSRDRYPLVSGPPAPGTDLAIGVTHAPYLRILDGMTRDGMDLIVAGHTHGGQLCVPFYGALVTNCDLDTRRASGLSSYELGGRRAALHVSAGLGTSPYSPIRFACPPEATLLTLVPRV